MTDTPQTEDPMVAALLRERVGYVGRDDKEDRVAAVDEQLRLRGYTPDGERIAEDAKASGEDGQEPKQRSTPPKSRRAPATEKA